MSLYVLFNIVGLALGIAFRYVTYKRFVFAAPLMDLSSVAQTRIDLSTSELPVVS